MGATQADIPFRCECGSAAGRLRAGAEADRIVCYCDDCKAYAQYLGRAETVLDDRGGTEIVAVSPAFLDIDAAHRLASLRMTEAGPYRWHCPSCKAPIGNTHANYKLPYVGLFRSCLQEPPGGDWEGALGPVRFRAFESEAVCADPPSRKHSGPGLFLMGFMWRLLLRRRRGEHKKTPFFDIATGQPVSTPATISPEERKRLIDRVRDMLKQRQGAA